MRIGLHFGKFIGGVIATTKINYDIFGVDVTIANQVETAGIPGKIVASDSLRRYLTHHFPGKYRFRWHGTIEILVPIDSKNQDPEYSQGVVPSQLNIYEICMGKIQ
ncbi:guanylate cyclase, putative [Perkinsus marinus ATCC 50983]|uniref:adenylate cyclase n=1 Tax=Perkinsus marinus (strain ATCC 50983 / TXsc) TaxID=423536 RepID=C5L9R4_PERM5|nr:guanylate cyclase, putative [Perkinsus marinus ATCC 50983]EER06529.1 guanylate cyclase, putative [Perkinsus marinus ATCC 50983]|eukprot:XP_002774713.1 guanylate cyclase, putative [Perkinsus marinus ATCC 50983]